MLTGPVDTTRTRPDCRRGGWQPAGPVGASTKPDSGGAGGRVRKPGALALPGSVEESFRRRADGLPLEARRLLLVAAAEPLGDPVLGRRAAALLGIGAGCGAAGGRRGPGRVRRPSAIPTAAGALGYLPRRVGSGPTAGARRPGRGHRSGDRPRPPCLAPRPGYPRTRRGRRLRSSSARPAGRRPARAWLPAPRSSIGPRRLRRIRTTVGAGAGRFPRIAPRRCTDRAIALIDPRGSWPLRLGSTDTG